MDREFVVRLTIGKPFNQRDPSFMWCADVTTVRAPAGQLDALQPTFATIGSSVKRLLPWLNTLLQVQQAFLVHQQEINDRILKNQADAARERLQIMHEYAQQSSQIVSDEIHRRYQEDMAAHERMQTREMHYIRDTGGYTNPRDGYTYELSAEYKYHCVDSNGDIIETNDPDIINQPGSDWKPMDRKD